MKQPKTASVTDLRRHASELVRGAAGGAVILIQRRGEPVAELRPITSKPKLPDMRALWRRMPAVPGDSGRFLEEER